MSITNTQTTVQLKSMSMRDLKDDLVQSLATQDLNLTTESLSDDELVLTVARNYLTKTVVKLERTRHRPLEIIVNVDYNKVASTKDVIRMTKPSKNPNDQYSFKWLWIPLVFGGLIIAIINFLGDSIATLFGSSDGLTSNQLILTVIILSIFFGVTWIYGLPVLLGKREDQMKNFDKEVLHLLTQRIEELDQSQTTTVTKKCWSCFKTIELNTLICPHCEVEQK